MQLSVYTDFMYRFTGNDFVDIQLWACAPVLWFHFLYSSLPMTSTVTGWLLWCVCLSTLAVQTFCSCTAGTDRQTDGSPTDIRVEDNSHIYYSKVQRFTRSATTSLTDLCNDLSFPKLTCFMLRHMLINLQILTYTDVFWFHYSVVVVFFKN